jgi:hypothetical protein
MLTTTEFLMIIGIVHATEKCRPAFTVSLLVHLSLTFVLLLSETVRCLCFRVLAKPVVVHLYKIYNLI